MLQIYAKTYMTATRTDPAPLPRGYRPAETLPRLEAAALRGRIAREAARRAEPRDITGEAS
ncbi:hypothetical protein [Oceanicola sp. S124]|uniref:hypothetical protein n=1 Tax=Oceanicola sp. S124 TaxID=1042378 RepID=UPI000255817C|nr:hypothetical protein [Oceanicola sp. S124]